MVAAAPRAAQMHLAAPQTLSGGCGMPMCPQTLLGRACVCMCVIRAGHRSGWLHSLCELRSREQPQPSQAQWKPRSHPSFYARPAWRRGPRVGGWSAPGGQLAEPRATWQ
jgi:hypothetical protein